MLNAAQSATTRRAGSLMKAPRRGCIHSPSSRLRRK